MFRPDAVIVRPSRYSFFFSVLIVLLCFLSVIFADVASFAPALFVLIIGFAVYLFRKYVFLLSGDSIVEVIWKEAGWWLTQKDGQVIEVEISPAVVVTGHFSLLCFSSLEDKAKTYRVMLFPDSANYDELRRLRVCVLQAL